MKRKIEFRGKEKTIGWVYGSLIDFGSQDYAIKLRYSEGSLVVNPETVGQYTGLKDKNGVKIYEGDILKITDIPNGYPPSGLVIVTWGKKANGWKLKCSIDDKWVKLKYYSLPSSSKMEVIGNIIDNPELIIKRFGNEK